MDFANSYLFAEQELWKYTSEEQRRGVVKVNDEVLDFVAGCFGGCAGILAGHPFDTVKVRMQVQNKHKIIYNGTFDCFRKIVQKESVMGLYKGMSSPLVGVAFLNAVLFGVYGNTRRNMEDSNTFRSHFIAGCAAGVAQSFILAPIELTKTRLQMQGQGVRFRQEIYKSPLDCFVKIYKAEGFCGITRGFWLTLGREGPSCGVYFLTFEVLCRLMKPVDKDIGMCGLLLAGGTSGMCSWSATYPLDVIKSRYQADGVSQRRYTGVLDCAKRSLQQEGLKLFTQGYMSTIIRAFPVNAATFTVVALVLRWMKKADEGSLEKSCSSWGAS